MRTILSVILFFLAGAAYCQTSPQIAISKEKVKVDGVIKYVHQVKSGETLYSLAKAYNVTIDEIVRNNESLKSGLKEGTTIFIPDATAKNVVQTKETTQTNEVEKAPVKSEKKGFTLSKENIKKYSRKRHSVKWHENLESIAKKYKVEADAIVVFNNLSSTQVKKKQILYIPNALFMQMYNTRIEEEAIEEKKEEVVAAAEEKKKETEEVENVSEKKYDWPYGKDIRLSYILPMNIKDSVRLSTSFMDFYAGAMLALNDIKDKGISLSAKVIDQQGKSTTDLAKEIEGYNVVIGPVKGSDIAKLLPVTDKGTTIISPLDQGSEGLIAGNANFIQVPPTQMTQIKNIVALLAKKYNGTQNIVLISENGGKDNSYIKSTKELLDTAAIKYTSLSYGILEGRDILQRIQNLLKPEIDNFVIVPSNSEAFVSDVVRNLNLLCTNPVEDNNRSITIFGTPRWRNFETIEVDYFHRMNLHLSTPYFVDYNRQEVKDFLMRYRAIYGAEPTPFAFQGYDITSYFILYPDTFGKMLQSNCSFKRNNTTDGFENTSTIDIIYNKDYTISVID